VNQNSRLLLSTSCAASSFPATSWTCRMRSHTQTFRLHHTRMMRVGKSSRLLLSLRCAASSFMATSWTCKVMPQPNL
jgi:hypothetical protein